MFKKIKKLFILFGILLFSLICVGCNQSTNKGDNLENQGLNEEITLNIKRSYILYFCNNDTGLDEILIEKYFGYYNNCYVVLIKELNKGDTGVLVDIVIGELTFSYPFSNRSILVWREGEFVSLEKAYETGLLQMDDLIKIHQMFYS